MSHISLIVQARMGSTRLPGKSMLPLYGKPLVYRILERLSKCNKIDSLILAIPDNPNDDILTEFDGIFGASVFRGSESNLIDRYIGAAKSVNADIIVRFPADNPVPEPLEIDKIINYHLEFKTPSFSTNLAEVHQSGYPDGIGAEVFNYSLLHQASLEEPTDSQKEHIHLNFFNYNTGLLANPNLCKVNTLICPERYRRPDIVLDVNTHSQYQYMSALYDSLYPANPEFGIQDIVDWHDNVWLKSRNHSLHLQ